MKADNFKIFYALLSLLLVIFAVQSYFIYDLKQSLEAKNNLGNLEKIAISKSYSDDFFNNYQADSIDPFEHMKKIQEEMQKSFGQFNSIFSNDPFFKEAYKNISTAPLSDVKENKDSYTIELNIPGADEQKIEIKNKGNYLTVYANSVKSSDINDTNYIHRERFTQKFERTFLLPDNADMNNIKSDYDKGILKIIIPKKR